MTSLLTTARAECEDRDLVVLALIERFNHDHEHRPNALSVAAHIKGAPIAGVRNLLDRLARVGVLERFNEHDFRVTALGIEVMVVEIAEFLPSSREEKRRRESIIRGGL